MQRRATFPRRNVGQDRKSLAGGWVAAGRGGRQSRGSPLLCAWHHAEPVPGILSSEGGPGITATLQGRSPLVSQARVGGSGRIPADDHPV